MATAEQTDNVTEYCEACGGIEAHEVKVAAVYCVECQQRLCRDCEEDHKKFKVTRRHLTAELRNQAFSQQRPLSTCEKHPDKYPDIYCFDCKKPICTMCCINVHNNHKCSDVNEIAGEFREQMTSDVDKIVIGLDTCREMLTKIETEKSDFIQQVAKAELEVDEKAEQLKQLIDVQKEKLMNELSSIKQKRMGEIESARAEIEKRLLSMESYREDVDEVRQKGTACDIARTAGDLHDRADELLNFDVIERTLHDVGHADVTFTSSKFVIDDVNKTLRHLRLSTLKTGLI